MEFGLSGNGTMAGLSILLANSNGRGGGDLHSDNPIIGSWAVDRIVIAGDYSDPVGMDATDNPEDGREERNWYQIARQEFEDISEKVIEALCDDPYFALYREERTKYIF